MLPENTPGKLGEQVLKMIYKTVDNAFSTLGNSTYQALGLYEPLILLILLDKHEEMRKAGEFHTWVMGELQDPSKSHFLELAEYLRKQNLDSSQIAELYGFFRHWGHPTVHEELSCEKTRVVGRTRSYPKLSTQWKMLGLLKRHFYISFLNKHGRQPRVKNLTSVLMLILVLDSYMCTRSRLWGVRDA
jgi:hypothetical protein